MIANENEMKVRRLNLSFFFLSFVEYHVLLSFNGDIMANYNFLREKQHFLQKNVLQ